MTENTISTTVSETKKKNPTLCENIKSLCINLSFWANTLNILLSCAYVIMDYTPNPPPIELSNLLVVLAAFYVIDSILYLCIWQHVEPSNYPTLLDISAEWSNVFASTIYFCSTLIQRFFLRDKVPLLSVYIVSALSVLLFFVEAILYAIAWIVSIHKEKKKTKNHCQYCTQILKDWYLYANLFNVLPAATYAVIGITSMVFAAQAIQTVGDVDIDGVVSYVRGSGRLPMGIPSIFARILVLADILYLIDAVLFFIAWRQDVSFQSYEQEMNQSTTDESSEKYDVLCRHHCRSKNKNQSLQKQIADIEMPARNNEVDRDSDDDEIKK